MEVTDSPAVAMLLRAEWATLLFALAAVALIVWVGHNLFVLHLGANHIRADYWEHTAAIRALMDAPFHPRNPQLDTEDPSPRFTPEYVLLSIVGRGLGLDAVGVMALAGTVNLVVLLAGIFLFFLN